MPKLTDAKMTVLDNDTVVVTAVYDMDARQPKTYGFAGWTEALNWLRTQTAPPITLAEVRELISRADTGSPDGNPG